MSKMDEAVLVGLRRWAAAPGMKLPEGAIALYTADLEVG